MIFFKFNPSFKKIFPSMKTSPIDIHSKELYISIRHSVTYIKIFKCIRMPNKNEPVVLHRHGVKNAVEFSIPIGQVLIRCLGQQL